MQRSDGRATIGPLSFAILGYQFPNATEYWDANWLVVDICCVDSPTDIAMRDPCLRTSEILGFSDDIVTFLAGASEAKLDPMEPYFRVKLARGDEDGRIEVEVNLRIHGLKETRSVAFWVTQAEVAEMQSQIEAVCVSFPVKVFDHV